MRDDVTTNLVLAVTYLNQLHLEPNALLAPPQRTRANLLTLALLLRELSSELGRFG